ncbi:MAG: serine/threonine protein kinase [Planctomycetes bacterium]|nr:serine/threonine protein kinase [Planctomycetota bacterium]
MRLRRLGPPSARGKRSRWPWLPECRHPRRGRGSPQAARCVPSSPRCPLAPILTPPMPEHPVPPTGDAYEDVLVQAIGLLERDDDSVELLLASYPSYATRLRAHLSRLHEFGFAGHLGPARPDAATVLPEQVDDYQLIRRLGSGGMGVVFLAHQQSLGREVALKLVRLDHMHLPGVLERFRREVATIARLQHPGIVRVHDAGDDGGMPWLAMEHVVGASLDAVVKHVGARDPAGLRGSDLWHAVLAALPGGTTNSVSPPPGTPFAVPWLTACLQLVRAVAVALHHAHERGVLHRDLKPSNVMVTLEGRAMLLDFGLAVAAGDPRLTRSGSQLGTLAYMAPEQLRGELDAADARSDVYSLAITAWELLSLRLPFAAESDAAIRERILAGELSPLRDHNRAVPRDVEIVLRKACDVDPARRYRDAAEFADDLANLLERRPIRAQAPSTWLLVRRWGQRHPARAIGLVAGLLLFLVAPTVFLLQAQAANRDIQRALDSANQQRQRADAQRDLAREAVDSLLERVANESLFDVPKMQRVRRDLLDRAQSFYERFLAASPDDLTLLEQTARATLQMVFVDGSLGQYERAMATAERAVELANRLRQRRPGDDDIGLLFADAVMTRGRVELTNARPETACTDFAAAAAIAHDVLARHPAHALATIRLLGIERGTSLAMKALGRESDYEAALDRLAELWRTGGPATIGHEDREAALDHVLCSGVDEAQFLLQEGRFDEARAACDRTEVVAAAVAGEPLPVSARVALASLPVIRARLDDGGGDPATQEARMLECLRQVDGLLVDDPELTHALRQRANMENALGLLLSEQPDRRREATAWFERSLATVRALVAADPSVLDNRANLAATLVNLGSQHKDDGEPDVAARLFAEAEMLAAEVTAAAPANPRWQQYRYNATWFVGQTCGDLGDHAGEIEAARRLAHLRPEDGTTQRIAAELLAQAMTALGADTRLPTAERKRRRVALEQEVLQRLEAAADHGYADAARLRESVKLAPLRELPGFEVVVRRVADNASGDK